MVLGSGLPWWFGVALGVAAVAAGVVGYRRALAAPEHGRRAIFALVALRTAATALVVLFLLSPSLRVERAPKDAQRVAVLVDTSRSMALRDSLGGAARVDVAAKLVRDRLREKLGRIASVSVQGFDATTHALDLDGPCAAGDASEIGAALRKAAAPVEGPPLAAIVVLTDGAETAARALGEAAPGVPVFPVGLGSVEEALAALPDAAVAAVVCDRDALVGTRVDVKVTVRATGLEGQTAVVELRRGERVEAEAQVVLGRAPVETTLSFVPREAGLLVHEARVRPLERETIVENNARPFALRVSSRKLRVLYHEGTPRWEYKFLSRELKRDPHVSIDLVLRTSSDRAYQSEASPSAFPGSREALRRFDAVVLGDVAPGDLSAEQGAALAAWVSEDGGGLVVLAGQESLGQGGLRAAGLERLLPAAPSGEGAITGTFAVKLTPEGATHPALAGLGRLLPLEGVHAVAAVRPGAQVLAQAEGERGARALVLAQRFGTGRVFFLASDQDWRWVLRHGDRGGAELFARFWGQAVRWVASREDAPGQDATLVVATDRSVVAIGEPVTVRVSGPKLDDVKEAQVGEERLVLRRAGPRLEAVFTPAAPGAHRVTAGGASCDFFVEPARAELDRLSLDEAGLRRLAAATGGLYFDAASAATLPDALVTSGALRVETREWALDESWPVLALAIALLAAEWAQRKRLQVT